MYTKTKASSIIDLSHTINRAISVYPGTPLPELEPIATVAADGFAEMKLTLTSHMGTHIDAPAHMIDGGKTLDQYTADRFAGPALVVDCQTTYPHAITTDLLTVWEAAIAQVDFVLLCTGWSDKWGTKDYLTGYPVLTQEAAHWLASKPIKGIGLDVLSPDPLEAHRYPIHHILLSQDLLIIENLTHLHQLAGQVFYFTCLPLKVEQSDAAPARAIALVDK